MTYSVEFLKRARKELLDAWDWYEDKQPGLGDRLFKEVEKAVQFIQQAPDRYPSRKKKFHELKIKTFPYLIIYQIFPQKKVIAIGAVFHTSRNPKKKFPRLKKL